MSAIYGCYNIKGVPIEKATLDIMKGAIEHLPFEGSSDWVCENTGLGQLLTYNTPEAKFEKQPLIDPSGRLVLVSRARIDNRDELYKILGFSVNELPMIPDSCFIMEAFKKWGKDCVHHLLGDWAFVIWDKQQKELFVARDHHGNTGLFYHYSQNQFFFASSIKSLLALKEIPKEINELFVTKVLVAWPRDGEETAYKNIFRLPPAHHLTLSPDKFEIKRYWYLEHTPLLHLKSAEDYYEQFLDIYQKAVKVRLRSYKPVAATLSGGLDSGSVCALAAEEVNKSNQRLQCYSSVPKYGISDLDLGKHRFGDETPYIKATAQFYDNIDLELLKSENTSVLDGIYKQIEVHSEPAHAAGNYYWISEILQKTNNHGFGTLLTGQGGNAVISWKGMPKELNIKQVLKQYYSKEMKLMEFCKSITKRYFPLLFDVLIDLSKTNSPWKNYSAINIKYASEINLVKKMKEAGHDPYFRKRKNAFNTRIDMIKPGKNQIGSLWQNNGLSFGIEVRDPTIDKRLLEFCMAVPDQYFRLEAYDRFFIRQALNGILTKEVLWNKRKGRQSSDIFYRVREIEGSLSGVLKDLNRSKLVRNIVDTKKLEKVLLDTSNNWMAISQLQNILLRGINVALFLKQSS